MTKFKVGDKLYFKGEGTKDIPPEDELLREQITTQLQRLFSRYGFVPLDTPIIERYDEDGAYCGAPELHIKL